MLGRPEFNGDCLGCMRCVAICPGLAITLVDKSYDKTKKTARITIPWEMPEKTVKIGQKIVTTGIEGKTIGKGIVIAIKKAKWQNKRQLLSLEAPYGDVDKITGIQIKKRHGVAHCKFNVLLPRRQIKRSAG